MSFILCLIGGRFLSISVRTHKTSNLEINVPFYNSLFLFNRGKRGPLCTGFAEWQPDLHRDIQGAAPSRWPSALLQEMFRE